MAYRLKHGESAEHGIRRILAEQVDRALGELARASEDRADAIHRVRKRCKKIRAALRLVRGGLGRAFARENAWYRDAARGLSELRDAEAMIETCVALEPRCAEPAERDALRSICARLQARNREVMADGTRIDALLDTFAVAMRTGRGRIASLHIAGHGYEAVQEGLRTTYARARTAMHIAYRDPSPANFHAWRKQAAYHWHHLCLLHNAWPAVMRSRSDEANRLAEALGLHHNLTVMRDRLRDDPAWLADDTLRATLTGIVDRWSEHIRGDCRRLGGRLFAEKPDALTRRVSVYLAMEPHGHG